MFSIDTINTILFASITVLLIIACYMDIKERNVSNKITLLILVFSTPLIYLNMQNIGFFHFAYLGVFYWGYCRYNKPSTRRICYAPYWVALVNCVVGAPLAFYTCEKIPFFWWGLMTMVMVISPLVDILYNYLKWKLDNRGDFAQAEKLKRWEK